MRNDPTPKQARFVDEYLLDRNGAQAAVRAGYSKKCAKEIAYELLTKPHIAAAVQNGMRETAERLQLSREALVEGLREAAEAAKARGDAGEMIAAWREIGRLLNLYPSTRQAERATASENRNFRAMRDEDLHALLE